MKKIYWDTFKGYFTSYVGYLFLALSLFTAGAAFFVFNIMLRSVDLAPMFTYTTWVVIFLLPFLTLKTANRKNIIPKHLAGLTMLFVLTLVMLAYGIVVMMFGNPSIMHVLGLYLSFFLLTATFLALSTFITVLTKNQIFSFIMTIVLFAAIRFMDLFAANFGANIDKLITWLSACRRFEPFLSGIFSFTSIVYYITSALVLVLAALMLKRGGKKAWFVSTVAICLFLIVNLFTTAYPIEMYINSASTFKLSDTTLDVLAKLDSPVNIITFYPEEDEEISHVDEIIAKYVAASPNITTYSVDPAKRPEVAEQFSLSEKKVKINSVVIESGGNFRLFNESELFVVDYMTKQHVALSAEDKLTTAIAHINDPIKNIVCSEGHTEVDLEFGNNKDLFNANGISLDTVDLKKDSIPKDTDIFLIVGPRNDFSKGEITKLNEYLEKGGAVQVYFDVDMPQLKELEAFLATWGLKFEADYVLDNDPKHNYSGKITLLMPEIISHPITDELIGNREIIIAPTSRSITLQEVDGTTHFELLKTSAKSYSKTNKDSVVIEMEPDDLPGPLVVAAGAKGQEGSILAFGTSQFIDPQNEDFIINSINWQIDNESSIYIPAREVENTVLTLIDWQITAVSTMVALLPILVFLAGITLKMLRKPV